MRTSLVIAAAVVVAASCTTEVVALSPGQAYFQAETAGGCAQLGPNCVRYVAYGDGTVEAYRIGVDDAVPVGVGSVDPALVAELAGEASTVDQAALLATLPVGECRGCYDGIDTMLWFFTTPAGEDPPFSSVEVDINSDESLLVLGRQLLAAVEATLEVPIVAR